MWLNYESFVVNMKLLITIQLTNAKILFHCERTKSSSGREGKMAVIKRLMSEKLLRNFIGMFI